MKQYDPKDLSTVEVQKLLLGGIAPRPIALVSTISKDGVRNLSPFSFFNGFGANPPMVAFSASRRIRNGSLKDTYQNLVATKECVIQAVTYEMVQQVSLASTEYGTEIDEFIKSGLTPIPSDKVKPFRVKESPFQMECILHEMKNLGENNGSGNLAICEVVKFHVSETVMENGVIKPDLINLVGRNSENYYTRANGTAIFEIEKPIGRTGIGYDNIPDFIKCSTILSANNLGQLGNSESIPDEDQVLQFINKLTGELNSEELQQKLSSDNYEDIFKASFILHQANQSKMNHTIYKAAKLALAQNDVQFAWLALMSIPFYFDKKI